MIYNTFFFYISFFFNLMYPYTCITYVISVLFGRFAVLPVICIVTTCNAEMIISSHHNNQNLGLILEIAHHTPFPPIRCRNILL